MTPRATDTYHHSPGDFSQRLQEHARALDLTQTIPVGNWSYGQGIRRADGVGFFWELSLKNFFPLGLHHPLFLRGEDETMACAPTPVPVAGRDDWQWSLCHRQDPWLLSKTWTQSSAWQQQSGSWLMETDPTFKKTSGWQGWEELDQLHGWAVALTEDIFWITSREVLPTGNAPRSLINASKLLVSPDVLAHWGRINSLRQELSHLFPDAEISGLNVKLKVKDANLFQQHGLSGDVLDHGTLGLCFPLSVLPEDLAAIAAIVKEKG